MIWERNEMQRRDYGPDGKVLQATFIFYVQLINPGFPLFLQHFPYKEKIWETKEIAKNGNYSMFRNMNHIRKMMTTVCLVKQEYIFVCGILFWISSWLPCCSLENLVLSLNLCVYHKIKRQQHFSPTRHYLLYPC